MNLILYQTNLDSKADFKDYFKEEKNLNITILSSTSKIKEDIEYYKPDIIIIDYTQASKGNYLPLKIIKRGDKEIFTMVGIPDFLAEEKLDFLLKFNLCHYLISNNAAFPEFKAVIHQIDRFMQQTEKHKSLKGDYDAMVDDYRDYKKTLAAKNEKIEDLESRLRAVVIEDTVTGLSNVKHFNSQAVITVEEAKRYKDNLCIVNISIDNIQQIEEVYGDTGRDFILKELGDMIRRLIRNNDIAAISDNHDHYIIMYKKIKPTMVRLVAERIKKRLEDEVFIFDNKQIRIAVSIGLASAINHRKINYELDELMEQARVSLDNARRKGGNTVVAYA